MPYGQEGRMTDPKLQAELLAKARASNAADPNSAAQIKATTEALMAENARYYQAMLDKQARSMGMGRRSRKTRKGGKSRKSRKGGRSRSRR